jgi:hypothetical protein
LVFLAIFIFNFILQYWFGWEFSFVIFLVFFLWGYHGFMFWVTCEFTCVYLSYFFSFFLLIDFFFSISSFYILLVRDRNFYQVTLFSRLKSWIWQANLVDSGFFFFFFNWILFFQFLHSTLNWLGIGLHDFFSIYSLLGYFIIHCFYDSNCMQG